MSTQTPAAASVASHSTETRATLPADFELSQIRIASPCHEDWAGMDGDERARFCGSCQKHVYNLSDMTAGDALALIRDKQGNLCVRYYQRADGTVLTADCKVGVRRERVRKVRKVAATVAFAAGLFGAGRALAGDLGQRQGDASAEHAMNTALMGKPMPPAACGTVVTYTVAQGDTLDSIAKTWQTDVDTLTDINSDLSPETLKAGIKIKVPMQVRAIKGEMAVPNPAAVPAMPMIMGEMEAPIAPVPAPVAQPAAPVAPHIGPAGGRVKMGKMVATPRPVAPTPTPAPAATPAPAQSAATE